jgi:hypothetical protein
MENNTNAYINESFIYMNDKKYAKASIILHKVLKKLYNGKNPIIENLLGKCYIEIKEFSKANVILKNLMMRFPDIITYKFNYGILLIAKSTEKLSKNDRKVKDTEEAIELIKRAIKIFEMINNIRRDEKEERILKYKDFFYKCSEMITVCKSNLTRANENLKEDQKKEFEMNLKIENNIKEYHKKLEVQRHNDELNKNKNMLSEENYQKNKVVEEELTYMTIEDPNKDKKKKKDKKDKKNNFDDELNDEHSFKEGKKKKKKFKKKIDENEEENENEELRNEYKELQKDNEENQNENNEDENENNENEGIKNNKMIIDDDEIGEKDDKMIIDDQEKENIENEDNQKDINENKSENDKNNENENQNDDIEKNDGNENKNDENINEEN